MDLKLPDGEKELTAFSGIFSGVVLTENHLVIAKFFRGCIALPYERVKRVRGGLFADNPNDPEEIRTWGLQIEAEYETFTVGTWRTAAAQVAIERAVTKAQVDANQR
jgi:hypothetical protein